MVCIHCGRFVRHHRNNIYTGLDGLADCAATRGWHWPDPRITWPG